MDYAKEYDEYWSRSDRWGSHSFKDPDAIVQQIVALCGKGKVLDVGFGMALLAQSLAKAGADVYGVDVAKRAVDEANRFSAGHFQVGSILSIPHEDNSFDTVTSTDCLEHIAEADVPQAVRELHRVTRRFAYIQLATTGDRDGRWHLSIHDRTWWERHFFEAGFRKHPLSQDVVPYAALEFDGRQITLVFEKLPAAALAKYPLSALKAERDLHMDMLREAGRRSDAHVARYFLARKYLPKNGVVVDVACGLGYGSAALAQTEPSNRVMGIDNSAYAIDYATHNFTTYTPNAEFQQGDACDLSRFADQSVDLVVSFETVEHLKEPELFFQEVKRILKPGGTFIGSVPNMWVDETGKDPNPWHFHVFDCSKFAALCQKFLFLESVYQQTAGGGMKLPNAPRRIDRLNLPVTDQDQAEWWIIAAVKGKEVAPALQGQPGSVVVLAPNPDHPLYRSWMPHCKLPVKVFSNVPADFQFPEDTAVVVTHDMYFEPGRTLIRRAVEANIPTLILADGILEYRNTFEQPQLAGTIFQPVLGHKVACLGRSQARTIERWGNMGKTEVVGSPRFDCFYGAKRRERRPNEPFRILITTALNPYFTEAHRVAILSSLRDFKKFFDSNKCFGETVIEPVWRLTKGLEQEIGIGSKGDTGGKDLMTLLQEVDALISTPSTCLLEGMLLGLPVATLDYCNVPLYVQPAWRITAQSHIAATVAELITPPAAKMLFQEETLHDALECNSPAVPRLLQLIEEMFSHGLQAKGRNGPLFLPANLLKSSHPDAASVENRFDFAKLFPNVAGQASDSNVGEIQRLKAAAEETRDRLLREQKSHWAQIYFNATGQYNEQESVRLLFPMGKWKRLTFRECHGRLRFDPADRPVMLTIAGMHVRSLKDGRLVWSAKSRAGFDSLVVGGHARRLPHDQLLSIFCFGNDPQVYFPDFNPNNPTEPLQLTVWIKAEDNFEPVVPFVAG